MNHLREIIVDRQDRLTFTRSARVLAELPRDFLLHTLKVRITGNIVVAAGSTDGTVDEDGIHNLVDEIGVRLEGQEPEKSWAGFTLFERNRIENQVAAFQLNPLATVGTHPFEINYDVHFAKPDIVGGADFALPTRRILTPNFFILWGNEDNIYNGSDRTHTAESVVVELVELVEDWIEDKHGPQAFRRLRELERLHTLTGANLLRGEEFDLDRDARFYRDVMFIARNNALRDNAIVTQIDILRGGGDNKITEAFFSALRNNHRRVTLATPPTGLALVRYGEQGKLDTLPLILGATKMRLNVKHNTAVGESEVVSAFQEILPETL